MANERLEYTLQIKDLANGTLKEVTINADRADKALGNLGNQAKKTGSTFDVFKGSVMASGFMSILGYAKDIGKAIWDLGTANDMAKASFTAMLNGNSKLAEDHIKDLQKMAQTTPFETKDLVEASKTLQQFGVDVKTTIPLMRALGDASGGNSERFKSMALVMGQVTSAGKLQGQDLLQFINAGWNPLNEIVKRTGETMSQVKDRMSKGGVGAGEVALALSDATKEGGKFFGLMETQSKTVGGKWSNFVDNISLKLLSFWNSNSNALGGLIDIANDVVTWFSDNWGNLVEVFKPLTDAFYDIGVAIMDVYKSLGLTGSAGDFLRNVFSRLGGVLQLLKPIIWVVKEGLILVIKVIGKLNSMILGAVDALLKLFNVSTEFKTKTAGSVLGKKGNTIQKPSNLNEYLKTGGGKEFAGITTAMSNSSSIGSNTSKTAKMSDIKNITINIGKMVEDLNISLVENRQLIPTIEREIKKVIGLAVNDFNAIAN